jgi:hypothetical protein
VASATRIATRVRMTCCIARSMATDYTNGNDVCLGRKIGEAQATGESIHCFTPSQRRVSPP